ncbi:hypothetical protein [Poritiphilus flavus]|uniref:Uncharacterized protein n=1 Tax=Poritiphilus flavus TaxID=2697053 RepID=A0A6L9E6Q3_9FLAO|nr:hypothetical protein [Poritiphilus flavus]NAS10370.1 hypothetical protein [Poritiphilus flavus]
MYFPIAMGYIDPDGNILESSPGIVVNMDLDPGISPSLGYRVKFPDGLVKDKNYIVVVTAETHEEEGDFMPTTIGIRHQSSSGFEVNIWAGFRESRTDRIDAAKSHWHFVVYDVRKYWKKKYWRKKFWKKLK